MELSFAICQSGAQTMYAPKEDESSGLDSGANFTELAWAKTGLIDCH
jgi:hypothetical protein